jgi:group I intron endonuclease
VGSGVNLGRRFSDYYSVKFLDKELKTGKSAIYSSLLKHGYSGFSLSILEYCEADVAISREQYYIDTLKPEYNILPTAGSAFGRLVTDETRAKLMASHIGRDYSGLKDHLACLKEANTGRKHTEEAKDKIRSSALGRKFADETRVKLGAISVLVTDIETNLTTPYISVTSAADAIGCDRKTIVSRIRANSLMPINSKFIVKELV